MKRIIDTTSSEFDRLPQRLRESHEGMILLGEDRRGDGSLRGVITIDTEELSKSMEGMRGGTPGDTRKFIEAIIDDEEDTMGHKKYLDVYADLLNDVAFSAELVTRGVDVSALKSKIQQRKV